MVGRCGLDASGSGKGPVVDPCEHDNKPLGSKKGGEFFNKVSEYQPLKKDSAPWSGLVRHVYDHQS
jgi:hypothetical protein